MHCPGDAQGNLLIRNVKITTFQNYSDMMKTFSDRARFVPKYTEWGEKGFF